VGEVSRSTAAQHDNDLQEQATVAAVAAARSVIANSDVYMATPLKDLEERAWNWIAAAAVFGWVQARLEQAQAQNRDPDELLRVMGLNPEPGDVAVVKSILRNLASSVKIDWNEPLMVWPENQMIDFLLAAWRLLEAAKEKRDHEKNQIARKPFIEDQGDPLPFP
jgi:hypothetical protein